MAVRAAFAKMNRQISGKYSAASFGGVPAGNLGNLFGFGKDAQ
jgi:hypothetical protein